MRASVSLLLLSLCGASWLEDDDLRRQTAKKVAVAPKKVVVDLDMAPADRWSHLAKDPLFANYKEDFMSYMEQFLKYKFVVDAIASIVAGLRGKFYDDYA